MFVITKDQLDYLEFPLGGYSKEETRDLAKKYGLEVADKPDSQDICFVPDGNYAKIIEKFRPGALDKGNIVDVNGNVLGTHEGIINFTIGQRRGLGISNPEPYYVIKIIPSDNTVVVGSEDQLKQRDFYIRDANWLIDDVAINKPLDAQVKIRSTHAPKDATISIDPNLGAYKITLADAQKSITPGQACVIYDGSKVLGGGWISAS